jgi:hypothetical protein
MADGTLANVCIKCRILPGTAQGRYIQTMLECLAVNATATGVNIQQRGIFMGKHGKSADGGFIQIIGRLFRTTLRFAIETIASIVLFGILVLGARATRWVNVKLSIPELTGLFKIIELLLLVLAVILCLLLIGVNTVNFIRGIIRDLRE